MKKTLTLLLLLISVCSYAQKVKLQLNLKKDSTYYLTTNAGLIITQSINGQEQKINTTIDGKVAHKVIAIHDTVYEMQVHYKDLSMHMDLAGRVMDFATGKDDTFSKIMGTLMNKNFTMFLSKTGRIVDLKDADKLYSGMFDSFPQFTEEQKAQFKAQMQKAFGDDAIKNNFQDAFPMFSAAKVGVNDKWVINTTISTGMDAKIKTTYTLLGITNDAYQVSGSSVIYSDGNPAYKELNGLPMRYTNIKGNADSQIKISKATGWITETKTTKVVNGIIEVKDSEKAPGGMTFPMTIDTTLNVTGK